MTDDSSVFESDEDVISYLAQSPFAVIYQRDTADWYRHQEQRFALQYLEERFRTYVETTKPIHARLVMRELLKCCRVFGLPTHAARLFMELGRVDNEAAAFQQITIKARRTSEPIRTFEERRKARKRRSTKANRDLSLANRVILYRENYKVPLSSAYQAVAQCTDAADYPSQTLICCSESTVKAAYLIWIKRYKAKDSSSITFENGPHRRVIHLASKGRPKGRK